jgi:hypothetical protein
MARPRRNWRVAGRLTMHALLVQRADQLEGCIEGSAEDRSIPLSVSAIVAYEQRRWPDDKTAGGVKVSCLAIPIAGAGQAPPRFFIVGEPRPGRPSVPRTMVGRNVESKPHRTGICATPASRRTPRRPQLKSYSFLRAEHRTLL